MTTTPPLPGMPLSPEHARQFDSLLATLTAEEALWISGYLASFGRHSPPAGVVLPPPLEPQLLTHLLILYGSETGHAEELARRAEELAQAGGLTVRCVDMADFRPMNIRDVRQLLVVTSTYGEGDPPLAAAEFCEFIQGRKAPRLESLHYAVLGLGDSSYEHFCQAAKDIDQRLEALGAERVLARADCDVDYERPATAWIDAALTVFAHKQVLREPLIFAAAAPPGRGSEGRQFDQNHPFPAAILDSFVLNGRGSGKETRHIELSMAGSGLRWEPGDALAVVPENAPELVAEFIASLDFKADMPVLEDGGTIPLAQALARRVEITTLTPGFLQHYAEVADAGSLRALVQPGQEHELRNYMAGRQVIDVVTEFPVRGLSAQDFLAMLRRQPARLYSIASSRAAFPDEIHLTVAVLRYESHGRKRQGAASTYLAERCQIDDTVAVYLSPNRHFRLPEDPATPIIMIGPGTGVAPFRAFLQEREAAGAAGRNWLFFGERHFRTDFLYQSEWLRLIKDRRLTRMDVAFSRDQEEKLYVQHRLRAHDREVYAWIKEGACIYVCGDAARMAADVHAALADVVSREGRMSQEQAQEYLRQRQREKRYQRDVY